MDFCPRRLSNATPFLRRSIFRFLALLADRIRLLRIAIFRFLPRGSPVAPFGRIYGKVGEILVELSNLDGLLVVKIGCSLNVLHER